MGGPESQLALGGGDGGETRKTKKISLCGDAIGHRPLWGCCPKSGFGDVAGPILNGSYHVFGICSYLKVEPCDQCEKNVCDKDHLLQALLQDAHDNKSFKGGVAAQDLNLQRNFQHIRIFNNLSEPPMYSFSIPNSNEKPVNLFLASQELTAYDYARLNQHFFPDGEIRLSESEVGGFKFDLAQNTPPDGVIVSILQSLESLKNKDFELALSVLEDSMEPKDLVGQSKEAASYALFIFTKYYMQKRMPSLTPCLIMND